MDAFAQALASEGLLAEMTLNHQLHRSGVTAPVQLSRWASKEEAVCLALPGVNEVIQ
jgi:hypothetical protein